MPHRNPEPPKNQYYRRITNWIAKWLSIERAWSTFSNLTRNLLGEILDHWTRFQFVNGSCTVIWKYCFGWSTGNKVQGVSPIISVPFHFSNARPDQHEIRKDLRVAKSNFFLDDTSLLKKRDSSVLLTLRGHRTKCQNESFWIVDFTYFIKFLLRF